MTAYLAVYICEKNTASDQHKQRCRALLIKKGANKLADVLLSLAQDSIHTYLKQQPLALHFFISKFKLD